MSRVFEFPVFSTVRSVLLFWLFDELLRIYFIMEGISVLERFFPLQDISEVVQLFRYEMENTKEPDLTLLSIVVGSIENLLTCNRTNIVPNESDIFGNPKLPTIEYKIVDALYKKFHSTIKGYVDMSVFGNIKYATRELVKRVSDVIWNSLTRSYYKDRAHLQSLYSYLTGEQNLLLFTLHQSAP